MDFKFGVVLLFFTVQAIQALPTPADLKQLEHFLDQYGPIPIEELEAAENFKIFDEKAAEGAEKADHHHKIEKLKHIAGKAAGVIQLTAEALNQIKHHHQDIFPVVLNLIKRLIELKQAELADHVLKDEKLLKYYGFDRHKVFFP